MDILALLAKFFEFGLWPLVTLLVVVLLRREIRELLPLVRKLEVGPLKLELERLAKVAEEAKQSAISVQMQLTALDQQAATQFAAFTASLEAMKEAIGSHDEVLTRLVSKMSTSPVTPELGRPSPVADEQITRAREPSSADRLRALEAVMRQPVSITITGQMRPKKRLIRLP